MHEWAHKKFCDWCGVTVYEVIYFNFRSLFAIRGGPLGYVVYAAPNKFSHAFWISTGPLVVNSMLAVVIGYGASKIAEGISAQLILYWIALSVGMHAFPSNQDAQNVLERSKREIAKNESKLHYLTYPFYWFICLANGLRRWWVDFTYAAVLVSIGSRF